MIWLIAGIVIWWGAHLFKRLAPARRAAMEQRMGEAARGPIALALLISVALMITGYRSAEFVPLYQPWPGMGHLNNLLMLLAFIMFGMATGRGWLSARMRHPMLVSVKIWAVAHLLVNGDLASVILFGSMLAWAVIEVIVINRADRSWKPDRSVPFGRRDIGLIVLWTILYGVVAWVHVWLGHNPFLGTYG